MAYTKAPPVSISETLRQMSPKTDILLRKASIMTVRTIISRIKAEDAARRYLAKDEPMRGESNIRVWRLK